MSSLRDRDAMTAPTTWPREVDSNSRPVMQLVDVRKTYPGPVEVLHGVNLRIGTGELVAIVSRKTVLLTVTLMPLL